MLKEYSYIIRPLYSLGYQIKLKMPKRYAPKLRRPTIFEDYFNTELSAYKYKNIPVRWSTNLKLSAYKYKNIPVRWSTKLSDNKNRHLKLNSFKNINIK